MTMLHQDVCNNSPHLAILLLVIQAKTGEFQWSKVFTTRMPQITSTFGLRRMQTLTVIINGYTVSELYHKSDNYRYTKLRNNVRLQYLPAMADAAANVGMYGCAGGKCAGLLLCTSISGKDFESPTVILLSR